MYSEGCQVLKYYFRQYLFPRFVPHNSLNIVLAFRRPFMLGTFKSDLGLLKQCDSEVNLTLLI